jgi:hypothetical protein
LADCVSRAGAVWLAHKIIPIVSLMIMIRNKIVKRPLRMAMRHGTPANVSTGRA